MKLTHEPPEGFKPNFLRVYGSFTDEYFDQCAKQVEFRHVTGSKVLAGALCIATTCNILCN